MRLTIEITPRDGDEFDLDETRELRETIDRAVGDVLFDRVHVHRWSVTTADDPGPVDND